MYLTINLLTKKNMKKLILLFVFISPLGVGGLFAQNLDVIGDINTKGKVKLNGNAGTVGQVLTSNGAAAPTWTSLVAPLATAGGRFSYRYENVTSQTSGNNVDNHFSSTLNAPTSQSAFISFDTGGGGGTDYNTNSDVTVDLNTGLFTFNRAGLYHFEGCLRMFLSCTNAGTQTAGLATNLSLLINGTTTSHIVNQVVLPFNGPVNASFDQYGGILSYSFDRYFTAGGTLRMKMNMFNINTAITITNLGLSAGGYVAGHFVSE
jgi:hypothetical protein